VPPSLSRASARSAAPSARQGSTSSRGVVHVAASTKFWVEVAAATDDHDADADGVGVANADVGVNADASPAKHTDDVEGAGGVEDSELALALAMSLEGIDKGDRRVKTSKF
jgi:hypothetical protein